MDLFSQVLDEVGSFQSGTQIRFAYLEDLKKIVCSLLRGNAQYFGQGDTYQDALGSALATFRASIDQQITALEEEATKKNAEVARLNALKAR